MGYRVCIIDDDDIYQFTTQRSLSKNPDVTEVLAFSYSVDAINFLKESKNEPEKLPDIILLDINMPEMDGWDFLNELRLFRDEVSHHFDIYLITSSINPSDINRAKQFGEIKSYIVKPVGSEIWAKIFGNLG
jgi:CheY-like chemotaxis protein